MKNSQSEKTLGSRTHIAPVVAAQSVVVVGGVAVSVADRQPISGAIGKLGNNGGVEAGRILTCETVDATLGVRAIDTRAAATLFCR